jgi:hypothetical protein
MIKLKEVFRMSEDQLYERIPKILLQKGYNRDDMIVFKNDYIYAQGNIPIMLVSHLDTVHSILPKNIFNDQKQNILWSPEGLGADDRAGVYSILKIVEGNFKPHILFTSGEESGGIGASYFVEDILEIPNIKYIIELDRQGNNDCVFYECINDTFIKFIESYGFIENYGSFTDISIICPSWNIAGVNLSIGYYNQHSKMEYLNITEMNKTIEKVKNMLITYPKDPFVFETYKIKKKKRKSKKYNIKTTIYNKPLNSLTDQEYLALERGLLQYDDYLDEYNTRYNY